MLELDRIYNEDCLEGMRKIPDESIDLIATDPPYKLTSRGSSGTMSGFIATDLGKKGRVFKHNDIEIEQYLSEFYRILKPDTHCYIMCNNLNLPHFFEAVSKSRFHFIKLLAWDKMAVICGQFYMGRIEHIFMLRKGKAKPINDCGKSDLLSFALKKDKDRNGRNIHDSQKPTALFMELVAMSSNQGETVLDPFMGSGTTAVACIKEKRHFIGFEKDREYYERALARLKNENSQLSLF